MNSLNNQVTTLKNDINNFKLNNKHLEKELKDKKSEYSNKFIKNLISFNNKSIKKYEKKLINLT